MSNLRMILLLLLMATTQSRVAGQEVVEQPCGERLLSNNFGENPISYTRKTVVYIYDFSQNTDRRKFYKVTKLKSGSLSTSPVDLSSEKLDPSSDVYLKVVNINKFLFEISITSPPPPDNSVLGTILPKNSLGDSMILTAWLGTLVNDADLVQLAGGADLQAFYNDVRCFLKDYAAEMEKVVKAAYNPCKGFPCCDHVDAMPLLKLTKALIDIRTKTIDIARLYDAAKDLLKTTKASLKACNTTEKKLTQLKQTLSTTPIDKQQAIQQQINDLEKQVCTDDKKAEYQAKIDKLSAIIAGLNSVRDLVVHLPTEAELKKLAGFEENMVKSTQEELYRLEVGANGLDLNLTIRSRDSVFNFFSLQPRTRLTMHQFIPVERKTQLSFSLGPFVGLPKYLQNYSYTWQALANNNSMVSPGSNYILVQSGYTHPVTGIAAMGNVEWKIVRSGLGIGLSGGAGLTFEKNARLTAMAGGSLFLGNWRQVILTVGVLATNIDRLTNNWQTVADKQIIYPNQPALSYYKELRLGGFLAVTVTPFKLHK